MFGIVLAQIFSFETGLVDTGAAHDNLIVTVVAVGGFTGAIVFLGSGTALFITFEGAGDNFALGGFNHQRYIYKLITIRTYI